MKKIIILLLALLLCCACSARNLKAKKSGDGGADKSSAISSSQAQPETEKSDVPDEAGADETEALCEPYAKMLISGRYYIDCTALISMEGMTIANPMLIAVDGENSSISVSSDLSGTMITMRTLTYENVVYLINDAARSYSEAQEGQGQNGFNTDFSALEYEGGGIGEFDGMQLPCAQYDCDGDTVRFFFKDNALAGLTRTIKDDYAGELALKINGLSQNIPDRLIALPLGYKKQ